MKWSPQPKGICARSDCDKDATQREYCMNHYHLFRRNGVPYRQDELSEMGQTNAYERDARAALDADPPVIVWRKIRGGVWVHVSVHDPHEDHQNQRRRGAVEKVVGPARLSKAPMCLDESLLAAARTEI